MRTALLTTLLALPLVAAAQLPGTRSLMDAHNCYPYDGKWNDRVPRALATGTPLAIEQDLNWFVPADSSPGRVVVAHEAPITGHEPDLETYFFDAIRPYVEKAMHDSDRSQWPLITLNLDFKTEQPEMLHTVWDILEKHKNWLFNSVKTADPNEKGTLYAAGPILVLTGTSDAQQKVFYDDLPIGARMYLFGAVHTNEKDITAEPDIIEPDPASNYRRWWNNPWKIVEAKGQRKAGPWTPESNARLKALVDHAHNNHLWIRFYTLDGASHEDMKINGWFETYNFGSLSEAKTRWNASIAAGVDFIASDQYEELAKTVQAARPPATRRISTRRKQTTAR